MLLSISNKTEADKQVKRNRLFFWLGIGFLLASMGTLIASASDSTGRLANIVIIIGYPLLILGLVLSKRGSFNNRRHGVGGYKIKSEEDMIAETMAKAPPRYHLYSWVKLGETQVDHLLVTPGGIMLVMAKNQLGDIKAGHDHYKRKLGMTNWIATLGEPGIGRPSLELAKQVKAVRSWFEQQGYELPVDGVVVFTNPQVKILGADEMSFPVCHLHDLPQVMRGWETELNMNATEQQEVENLIIKTLPVEQADEARALAQMPGYKRAALLKTATVEKEAPKEKAKPKVEEAPKPRLTPEERERLRQEKIKAEQEKGRQPSNPLVPPQLSPNQRMGLDGKVRTIEPAKDDKKKPARRRVEPLRRPTPGAFGQIPSEDKRNK